VAKGPHMTRTPLIIALAAAAALAGCHATTIDLNKNNSSDETNVATNAPVALPPSITAQKVYRCADNKIVYVDWMSDGKTANVRTDKGGNSTVVTAAEAGKPMTAPGGYSVEGTSGASTAKIAVPGHPAQSCKA